MKILINGLYRSGNHWSESIINNNIDNCHAEHQYFYISNRQRYFDNFDFYIFLFKNPYHWINSIIKQSWDMPFYYDLEPTDACYRIDINIGYPREKIQDISFRKTHNISLQKLVKCYNNYFYYWTNNVEQFKKSYIFIQYEKILENPEKFLEYLCHKNGLKKKSIFVNADSVEYSRDWKSNRKSVYLNSPIVDKKILPIINEVLDDDVMKLLQFQYLS